MCSYFILDNYLVTSITIILCYFQGWRTLPIFMLERVGGERRRRRRKKEASWGHLMWENIKISSSGKHFFSNTENLLLLLLICYLWSPELAKRRRRRRRRSGTHQFCSYYLQLWEKKGGLVWRVAWRKKGRFLGSSLFFWEKIFCL